MLLSYGSARFSLDLGYVSHITFPDRKCFACDQNLIKFRTLGGSTQRNYVGIQIQTVILPQTLEHICEKSKRSRGDVRNSLEKRNKTKKKRNDQVVICGAKITIEASVLSLT